MAACNPDANRLCVAHSSHCLLAEIGRPAGSGRIDGKVVDRQQSARKFVGEGASDATNPPNTLA
jgi:hypothetical protein